MSHPNKRPVTVEDLLRLKRAERPPAEFWDRFDRELRAKQLAALVEKRPWWQTMPRVFAGWRRYHLPLGATAVLAVTFLSLRDYPASTVEPVDPAIRSAQPVSAPMVAAVTAPVPEIISAQSFVSVTAPAIDPEPAVDAVASSSSLAPGEASNLVSLLGAASEEQSSRNELAPSARYIAANLAAARVAEPIIGRGLLAATPAAELRTLPRGTVVEPLAQMSLPGEGRRARLISAVMLAAATDSVSRPGERIGRNLSDERLNEEAMRRIKVKGDRLSLKL